MVIGFMIKLIFINYFKNEENKSTQSIEFMLPAMLVRKINGLILIYTYLWQ
jgi:hypothetical protein